LVKSVKSVNKDKSAKSVNKDKSAKLAVRDARLPRRVLREVVK
jgi:hypothetical protein